MQPALRLALAAALCCAAPSRGLDPHRDLGDFQRSQWTQRDGLPQNSAETIRQTRDGYLWIGTQEGLARFDGVRFEIFDRARVPVLGSNYVTALFEDGAGTLWVGTHLGGAARRVDGAFTALGSADGLPDPSVMAFAEYRGDVILGTLKGLARWHEGKVTVEGLGNEALVDRRVLALSPSSDGGLWVGAVGGVYKLGENGLRPHPVNASLPDKIVKAVLEFHGALWVGTYGGLLRIDARETRRFGAADGLPSDRILDLLVDRDDQLWVATDGAGVSRLEGDRFVADPKRARTGDTILALAEDREGGLWLGLDGTGLMRLSDPRLVTYHPAPGEPSDSVISVYEDPAGAVWMGTYGGGLSRLRGGTSIRETERIGLRNPHVWAMLVDRGGVFWVGTENGLTRFDGRRSRTFAAADGFPTAIRALLEDRAGRLWVGADNGGVSVFDGGKLDRISERLGMPVDTVWSMLQARDGAVWAATSTDGIFRIDGERFQHFTTTDGLPSDAVLTLLESRSGDVWAGTQNGGLARWHGGRWTSFRAQDGLCENTLFAILEDGRGYFWLSSNKGVFRLREWELDAFAEGRVPRLTCERFGVEDGMASAESNSGAQAGWRGHDDRLWFATAEGAAVADPARWPVNSLPPPVTIERVIADQAPASQAQRLPAGTRNVEFHYSAPSFVAPTRITFRYRLAGFDHSWVEAGARRDAYYTNLPPGEYRFAVLAANSDGRWSPEPAVFVFSVAPFFYQTPGFIALCIVLVAAGAAVIYWQRIRQLRARHAAVLAERNRMACELHDTLAQSLAGIGMQLEAAAHRVGDAPGGANVRRARDLVASSQGEVRRSVWNLGPEILAERGLPAALSAGLRPLTEGSGTLAELQVRGEPRRLGSDVETNLLRVGQEAIGNAVRHGSAAKVAVELEFAERRVTLRVTDDGAGFDPDAPATGFGLASMQERARRIGARLEIASRPGQGTVVTAVWPAGRRGRT